MGPAGGPPKASLGQRTPREASPRLPGRPRDLTKIRSPGQSSAPNNKNATPRDERKTTGYGQAPAGAAGRNDAWQDNEPLLATAAKH